MKKFNFESTMAGIMIGAIIFAVIMGITKYDSVATKIKAKPEKHAVCLCVVRKLQKERRKGEKKMITEINDIDHLNRILRSGSVSYIGWGGHTFNLTLSKEGSYLLNGVEAVAETTVHSGQKIKLVPKDLYEALKIIRKYKNGEDNDE